MGPIALPIACLRGWLNSRETFERDWPLELRNLWNILRGKANATMVNSIWTRHRPLLNEGRSTKLSSHVLVGIIQHEGGELDKELQRSILTCGCIIPPEITEDDILRVTDTTLRHIKSSDLPGNADPRVVKLVAQEMARREDKD